MGIYGYCRVSTDMQSERGYGIDMQEREISKYCKKQDIKLEKILYDRGTSGKEVERDGLWELISLLQMEDKVIVLNTSRLWRDDPSKYVIKREFVKKKVDVISVEQPTYSLYSKDPSDFLFNAIMEALDQYDRMSINLKLFRGRKTKVHSGIKGCGTAPLGYVWSHKGKKPEIVKDVQTEGLVIEIFSKYLELKSAQKVARYLNDKGYKTSQGKEFSPFAINKILRNRFYIGELHWGNVSTQGNHEPLVNKIVFGKVQALLTKNRKQ